MDEGGGETTGRFRLVQWNHKQELQEKLVTESVEVFGLTGPDDELGFEVSLGAPATEASRGLSFGTSLATNRALPHSLNLGKYPRQYAPGSWEWTR